MTDQTQQNFVRFQTFVSAELVDTDGQTIIIGPRDATRLQLLRAAVFAHENRLPADSKFDFESAGTFRTSHTFRTPPLDAHNDTR